MDPKITLGVMRIPYRLTFCSQANTIASLNDAYIVFLKFKIGTLQRGGCISHLDLWKPFEVVFLRQGVSPVLESLSDDRRNSFVVEFDTGPSYFANQIVLEPALKRSMKTLVDL